ncbi:group III truncated hemoglobin [Fodinicurvata fenggangensis]|uniref:group III truncated hemoglobin n=1 Tax=Fodinicurvata fenggangensis TaxID=1121830 RepID=UPI00068C0464|nr:group III truncated hemoglobin [Fodinicurvata fenggangensis]
MQTHAEESAGFPPVNPPITSVVIDRLVRDFHARIRKDPVLAPVFLEAIGQDWDSHMARMRRFWSAEMLGTERELDDPAPTHRSLQELRPAHFDRWLDLFRQSAFSICDRQSAYAFVARAERIAEQRKHAVFQKAGLTAPYWLRAATAQEARS